MKAYQSKLTLAVHAGSTGDPQYGGIVSPIYPASAYTYDSLVRYPRYFNTPNQEAVVKKMIALEGADDGIVFSSGMAAIMTSMIAVLKHGDHIVLQNDLYGGTHHAVQEELPRYGISYTMVEAKDPENFERAIRKETKAIYIETPSNPLLKITDLAAVSAIARKHGLITLIDNTFASPVNLNPIEWGIDIVLHSGTKYIGGHSDVCCGVMVGSKKLTEQIKGVAVNLGGSPDANTCYMVERSLKTLYLRVRQQNHSAQRVAEFLQTERNVSSVYYPGLSSHPNYEIAKTQMKGGFGGMLSFDLKGEVEPFIRKLKMIRKAVSLGGLETTIMQPVKTSHKNLTETELRAVGISDRLLRVSIGIEETDDIIADLQSALV